MAKEREELLSLLQKEGYLKNTRVTGMKARCTVGVVIYTLMVVSMKENGWKERYIVSLLKSIKSFILKMHGKGTYIFPNGNRYEGEWMDDMKSGYGILFYVNGEKYEGFWELDKAHGKGTLTYINGTKYVGDFKNASKHGKVMPHSRKELTFKQGDLFYSNGDTFSGEWKNDRANGQGVLVYANGNRYEGNWKDDRVMTF